MDYTWRQTETAQDRDKWRAMMTYVLDKGKEDEDSASVKH